MAYNDQNGNTVLSTVNSTVYNVNRTNLQSNVSVTGYSDSLWTPWGGLIGAQVGLPYDSVKSNSYVNLYARHMGGWAQVNLGSDLTNDVYDTFALQRTGDWVMNLGGVDKVIGGAGAGTNVNVYVTSNANFNTDGSLASIHAGTGVQNVSIESGLTGNQTWIRQKNEYTGWGAWGELYDSWYTTSADPAFTTAYFDTADHNNREQYTVGSALSVGLTQNAAGDVNSSSTISLGEGTDSLSLLNNVRMVTDYWWQSYWIFGGAWHAYTYSENAWTVYWTGSNWNAYNNVKDYTVSISTDVETIYFSYVNDNGTVDYQVLNGNSPTVNHYSGGFPGQGGSTPNNNPTNPLSLGDGGFVPDTNTDGGATANIQVVAPKGSKIAFYTGTGYHNEGDTSVDQTTLSGLTVMNGGAQTVSFAARDTGTDSAGAELGVIRITMGASYGDSQYHLYLGNNGSGDTANFGAATMKVLAYGFNGNDHLNGSAYSDTLVGGDGADTLSGADGNDSLFGGAGNDAINGDAGTDWMDGENGDDILDGSNDASASDTIFGGAGNDTLYGSDNDYLLGGEGNDIIYANIQSGSSAVYDVVGNNVVYIWGTDKVYFAHQGGGATAYTNTVIGNPSNSIMMLEIGSTSRLGGSDGLVDRNYVWVPDSDKTTLDASSAAASSDVISFYGGDVYDQYWSDSTFWGFWTGRSYWSSTNLVNNPTNYEVNGLTNASSVFDWASDGAAYDLHGTSGHFAPSAPDQSTAYESITGINVTTGWKGYMTFQYGNYTYVFYGNAGAGSALIDSSELIYVGRYEGWGPNNFQFSSIAAGVPTNSNSSSSDAPPVVLDGIDLAAADDTGSSNTDNLTDQTTALTFSATAVNTYDIRVYVQAATGVDGNGDPVYANAPVISQTITSPTVGSVSVDLNLTSNTFGAYKIWFVQSQTATWPSFSASDLDAASSLQVTVKTDITPPVIDAVTATDTQLAVTVHDAWADISNNVDVALVKASDGTAISSVNDLSYSGGTATFTPAAQSVVTEAAIKVTDVSGNFTTSSSSVILGTTGNDSITGSSSNDIIFAFGGADTIIGGLGVDTIVGGAGSNTYTFSTTTATDTTNTIANMDVVIGADVGNIFDLSALPNYDANSFTIDLDPASVGNNDYIASWTTTVGGVTTTNYVYLKDAALSGGFGFTESAGVVTLGVPAVISSGPLTPLFSGPSSIASGSFSSGTPIVLSMGAIDALVGWHKPLSFSKQSDFTNTVLVTSTTVNSTNPDLVVIDDALSNTLSTAAAVDVYLDTQLTWTNGGGNAGLAVTTDGVNTYVFADVHYDRSAENLATIGANNPAMYQRPLAGASDASLILTVTGLADTTAITSSYFSISGEIILGTAGNDSITGTTGHDGIHGGAGADTLTGGAGDDFLTGDGSTGAAGADTFVIDAGNDTILDLAASNLADVIQVSGGASVSATAYGSWTATASSSNLGTSATIDAKGQTLDLSAITTGNGWTLKDTSTSATSFTGSGLADTITGGAGADTMTGGSGNDVFVYTASTDTTTTSNAYSAMDILNGFTVGQDTIDVSALSTSPTLGTPTRGNWNGTTFTAGAGDDWVVSWTVSGATNYVLLKDTTETNILNVVNSNGVLSFNATPPAPTAPLLGASASFGPFGAWGNSPGYSNGVAYSNTWYDFPWFTNGTTNVERWDFDPSALLTATGMDHIGDFTWAVNGNYADMFRQTSATSATLIWTEELAVTSLRGTNVTVDIYQRSPLVGVNTTDIDANIHYQFSVYWG